MSNECIPLYDDGDKVPMLATVAVTGKRFVANVGTFDANTNVLNAALPSAGGAAFGIAAYDAPAGAVFPVIQVGNPLIVPATAGAAITANQLLQVDATGAVEPLVTVVPGAPTISLGTAASGGTFAAGSYFWKLTTVINGVESAASNEITATLTANQQQPITWTAVSGATGYRLYRGTATGAENVLVAALGTVTTYTDTGTAGTAGTPPASTPVVGIAVAQAVTSQATAGQDVYIRLTAN